MGGVIYIGDRRAGKTHLAMELVNPNHQFVMVDSVAYQKIPKGDKSIATPDQQSIHDRYFEVKVHLPNGEKTIMTNWLDTPGEIWRPSWQSQNPNEWQNFIDHLQDAEGILLILAPYREILDPHLPEYHEFVTRKQWINRFDRWVKFFKQYCSRIEHLLLCLNKADLFCGNLKEESQNLAYDPHYQRMTWEQKDRYVYHRYFNPIHSYINELNRNIDDLSIRCFITTIDNRELLELPWIYLGSYLAK